jgi:molybdopterin-containing oxidoreductase family iron-sulfur binding subunit
MGNTKKYWRGIEELKQSPDFVENQDKEFAEYVPVNEFLEDEKSLSAASTSRRDFLKFLGFSVTAASLAACETPVTKAIPYLNKPEEVNPGVANWYASSFYDGTDYASILVKTREGRPIFIEGNSASKLTMGGVNARVNTSVLSLYDSHRIQQPLVKGEAASWAKADGAIVKQLEEIAARGGNITLLTHSVISPSTLAAVRAFQSKYSTEENGATVKHVSYDSVSYAGMLDANEATFGKRSIPSYHFDKAKTIVSIGADFAANWLNGITYSIQYAKGRKPEGEWMSKHYQFESLMSLTGSNADVRVPVKPSEQGKVVAALYNAIAQKTGGQAIAAAKTAVDDKIAAAAKDLLAAKGASLVVCGVNNAATQTLVNGINNMLSNYGATIDINTTLNTKQGNDKEVAKLVKDMKSGAVDALLVYGVDPAYTLPNGAEFKSALSKVKLSVSFAGTPDVTSEACQYVCPDHHFLESWNDAMPATGQYSLTQPTISPLYKTRQMAESLLAWSGNEQSYHDFIKAHWEANIFPKAANTLLFADFWHNSLHDGVVELKGEVAADSPAFNAEGMGAAAQQVAKVKGGEIELELYQKVGIGDGKHAANPWLQELPDPITKITWDNYVTMAPSDMEERMYNTLLGQEQRTNRVVVKVNGVASEPLPVVAQPGQPKGTIGIAIGYGKQVWKLKEKVGVDVYPLSSYQNDYISFTASNVQLEDVEGSYEIAATQTHHTVMGRESVIKETDLATFKKGDRNAYNKPVVLPVHGGKKAVKEIDLWADHPVENVGHRWGMAIDLNTCLGCGSCITACHAENNVPVVGKDEIRRGRDMHWLRIDRYYSSEEEALPKSERSYGKMEVPESNPQVVHQPMMCQHCNHAPCETVCPVAATTHSNEGLNQMAYNRCIGTRYCANNCPYKVRRFNWFNYIGYSKFEDVNPTQDDLGRMVLNPDVVVRSRGVMEKCSMCVQRIQAGKLEAKKAGEMVKDGSIQTACSASCPSGSITFGDLNDESSKVRERSTSDRAYKVLEEVGTQSNIAYLTKVRNVENNQA